MLFLGMIQRRFLRQERCSIRKAWYQNQPDSLSFHFWRTLLAASRVRHLQKQSQSRWCWYYFGASNSPYPSRIDFAVDLPFSSDLVPCIHSAFVILTMNDLLVVVRDQGMDYVFEFVRRIVYVADGLGVDQRVVVSLLRVAKGKDSSSCCKAWK